MRARISASPATRPARNVAPNSYSNPRNWFTCMVRNLTSNDAHPVQSEHRLLIFGLRRHGAHLRLLHRRPDRPRVGRIGLVRLHKGSNELRMQQHDFMPERLDLARPPVPAAARFQRHSTAGRCARNRINSSRPKRRFTISPVCASTQYSWNTRFAISNPYVVAFISGPPFLKWLCHNSTLALRCRSVLEASPLLSPSSPVGRLLSGTLCGSSRLPEAAVGSAAGTMVPDQSRVRASRTVRWLFLSRQDGLRMCAVL